MVALMRHQFTSHLLPTNLAGLSIDRDQSKLLFSGGLLPTPTAAAIPAVAALRRVARLSRRCCLTKDRRWTRHSIPTEVGFFRLLLSGRDGSLHENLIAPDDGSACP